MDEILAAMEDEGSVPRAQMNSRLTITRLQAPLESEVWASSMTVRALEGGIIKVFGMLELLAFRTELLELRPLTLRLLVRLRYPVVPKEFVLT